MIQCEFCNNERAVYIFEKNYNDYYVCHECSKKQLGGILKDLNAVQEPCS